ncbi:MAG: ABC transporter ATP-binding protein [Balneolaceae bacterium]|nr:ABC transporter ATP-binding protein [Balneolaceae bacterium]MBO6544845.1 ABC transporter ATP-binding protein [Balneolaceae bacterium]MBO6646241.1 ABC transporter ATP-binding protein [Balneolaceae bacterium]
MSKKQIKVESLSKSFNVSGSDFQVFSNLNFQLPPGKITSIIGPSGCGKTTLLEIIANLKAPTTGKIFFDGFENHPEINPLLIFQEYSKSLYEFYNVEENILIALESLNISQANKEFRTNKALNAINLQDFKDLYPWQLSGGMQQRVSFARAIAMRPPVILLDEPFGSVDAYTRYQLEDTLLEIKEKFELTCVFVTHDIESAIYCADQLIILSKRPASILSVMGITFNESRSQSVTKSSDQFMKYRRDIYEILFEDAG